MLRILMLAVLAAFSFSGAAEAATLTINTSGTNSYSSLGYNVHHFVNGNIDAGSYVLNHGSSGTYSVGHSESDARSPTPTGPSYPGTYYHGTYAYITGGVVGEEPVGSKVTYTLASGVNSFGLTWGSIDAYNTLSLYDAADNLLYTLTGSSLLQFALDAKVYGLKAGESQLDVVFNVASGLIKKVVVESTQNSFELANLSAVPLPPSIVLFISALLAMTGFAAYRKRA